MRLNWTRIVREDGQYRISTPGCDCCREDRVFPKHEWLEEEYYTPIVPSDLDSLQANLEEQLRLVAELREKLNV